MLTLQSTPADTAARAAALDRYFASNVMARGKLTCATGEQCESSHPGTFYKGQLHHVGRHYDLVRDGKPLRVVVVGQEYGHDPEFVTLEARREIIVGDSGTRSRFKKEPDCASFRNPHMKGCTSLLRLIFRRGLGSDYHGEFLDIAGERVHVFECFALVNFLLCSAVPLSDGRPRTKLGGKRGQSTPIMRANCARHFQVALEALEPTLVVAQGHGVREWIARAYGLPKERPQDHEEPMQIGNTAATLLTFTHPSTPNATQNWGLNERTPYLRNIVAPTIARVCDPIGITGTWQLAVETNQGSDTLTLVLQQHGEQITGTFNSQIFGEAKITGTVKGNAIELGFERSAGDQKIEVSYTGTVESPTTMKGTAVYVGFDENATWTATKK
jgi:hypothetical protein